MLNQDTDMDARELGHKGGMFKPSKLRTIYDFIEIKVPQKVTDPSFGKFMEGCIVILKAMIIEDLLPPDQIINHLDYLIDVSQTLQKCHLQHVLNCDLAYRRDQFHLGFAWGKISEELKSTYLFDFEDIHESKDKGDVSTGLESAFIKQDINFCEEPLDSAVLTDQIIKQEVMEDMDVVGDQTSNIMQVEDDLASESSSGEVESLPDRENDSDPDYDPLCEKPGHEVVSFTKAKTIGVRKKYTKKQVNKHLLIDKTHKDIKSTTCDEFGLDKESIEETSGLEPIVGKPGLDYENIAERDGLNDSMTEMHQSKLSDLVQDVKKKGKEKKGRQRNLVCSVCGEKFWQQRWLESHMRKHTGEKLFKCPYCDKCFAQNRVMKQHMWTHGEKQHSCHVCGKMFHQRSDLTVHVRGHTGEKPHKCGVCGKGFVKNAEMKYHMRNHTGEKPYTCEYCGKCFRQTSALSLHRQLHEGKKHECPVCNNKYSSKAQLAAHMRTHTGERPYVCEVCAKAFKEKGHLKEHMHIHTGVKPHKCDLCNKQFSRKNEMQKHRRRHLGEEEKKWTCDVCGYRCLAEQALVVHKRVHTGERPFQCKYCDKAFTMQSARSRHERIHTGEKPYKCHVCEQAFNDSSTLKKHMFVHNKEKPHICDICNKAFPWSHLLKKHMESHNMYNAN